MHVKGRLLAAALVAVAGGAAWWSLRDGGTTPPVPAPRATADCSTGPWADHCPEAGWARDVARAAGFRVTGDTGSALTIERQGLAFHLWAFTPEEPELRTRQLRQEAYEHVESVAGVRIYADGQRLTWDSYGLHVWMAQAGLGGLDVGVPGVADVVRASLQVPWP
ncbi:MAG: hypothetical protein M3279_08985 [Actinomycetota bacterium]|nr:hypothetical protein [Actinomycetota bacterium]